MKYELILFDFDGTVIDGSEGIFNCIRYALGEMGKEIPGDDVLRRFVGPSLFDGYMDNIEKDPDNAQRFMSLYRVRYAPTGYAECRLYDGIADVVKRLGDEGYKVAVCSSKPYDFVKKIVDLLGITELFGFYSCPGFSSTVSEKSELILEAARYFGVSKEKTLMIGDRLFDVESAKKAGVDSMGVLYGFAQPGEFEQYVPVYTAGTTADIYDIIKAAEKGSPEKGETI